MSNTPSLGRLLDASHIAVERLDSIHDDPVAKRASANLSRAAAAVAAEALASTGVAPMSNTQAERVEALMSEVRAYASSYRLVGGRFDNGGEQAQCDRNEADVRAAITSFVAENEALRADAELIAAATAWWEGKCPVAWTDEQHLQNPAVNTSNPAEYRLAWAIAARNTTQQQGG